MALNPTPPKLALNTPVVSLVAAVALVALGVFAVAFVPSSTTSPALLTIVGLIATTVPSLIAAGFAERNSRDMRNGVATDAAAAGAHRALEESGVKEVVDMTHRGASTTLTMQALAKLLELNTTATTENTAATQTSTNAVQQATTTTPEGAAHPKPAAS